MFFFKLEEFKCKCCGKVQMDKDLLFRLDHARWIAGIPFIITSGFRCEDYNRSIGGRENSAHLTGKAADIYVKNSNQRYKTLSALLIAGFKRIGLRQDFIHVDVDDYKQPNVCWL